jgi:outer membrane protein
MKHSIYKKMAAGAVCLVAAIYSKPALGQQDKNADPFSKQGKNGQAFYVNGKQAVSPDANARSLSLDEAIKLSLQNSKQLKLSSARIAEATANYHDAWNNHLPDVKATGAYLRVNDPTIDLKVKLPTSSSDTTKTSSIKVNQAAYGLVNASLPLFSGFRIKYGVESAKYLEQAAKLDADNDKDAVVLNTVNAFSNLYKSRNSVDLVKQNLEQEQQQVKDFNNMMTNGLMARNDVLKAQLQESNIELTLLDAQNNYKMACVNMDLMLGLPESTEFLPDTSLFQNNQDAGTVLGWEQAAFLNRKDLNALSFREKAAVSSIKSTKGEYYPGIALTGGYVAMDIPNLLTVYNALNIGVGLQYNFGALWKTGAKVDAAKARLHELEANEGLLTDQVRLQINQAYENYLLAKRKIEVYQVAIDQATENYRITKNKHENNLVTTTDLLEADVAQLQAELNYAFAKVDAVVAYKTLQQTAGIISK